MSEETTPKAVEHRIINTDQCPRCGSLRTESIGSDDTLTDSRNCLDCQAKNPDGEPTDCTYDVCCCEIVEAVRWCDSEGPDEYGTEHEVYDSHYLAGVEAMNALACLGEFTQDVEAVGIEKVAEEWPDLVATYHRAKAIIARAKGEST
jgi:RNA polymerase subunit RPABC4/transcription elongation factor Spt4